MKPLAGGDVLVVLATDPGAGPDFATFCAATGHRLLATREAGGELTIEIEKVA
jgi:TusA-related sulfurtransferase